MNSKLQAWGELALLADSVKFVKDYSLVNCGEFKILWGDGTSDYFKNQNDGIKAIRAKEFETIEKELAHEYGREEYC